MIGDTSFVRYALLGTLPSNQTAKFDHAQVILLGANTVGETKQANRAKHTGK